MIEEIIQLDQVKDLVPYVILDISKLAAPAAVLLTLESLIEESKRREYSLVVSILSESFHKLGFPRDVEAVCLHRAHNAQQTDGLLTDFLRAPRHLFVFYQAEHLTNEDVQDIRPNEDLSQADVLGYLVEALNHSETDFDRHVACVVDRDHLHEVTLLNDANNLAARGQSLDALAGQRNLFVVEELPLLEAE